jgi:diguanylate cyclase (GGDEF)-like protein/PAS domain S-box-containing protein
VEDRGSNFGWPARSRKARRYGLPLSLASCFAIVFAATFFVGLDDTGNVIWAANGFLLAYLLLAPRWRWARYLGVGFAAEFAGGVAVHPDRWCFYLALAGLNIVEVSIGALLVRRKSTHLPHFTQQAYLIRFVAYAVLFAPIAAGSLFALCYFLWLRVSPWHGFLTWVTTDSLGTAIATPALVAIFLPRKKLAVQWRAHWWCPVLLVATTFGAFSQTHAPVIFLIYPLVALLLFRFGVGWASTASLFIAATGSWFTVRGLGPFANEASFSLVGPMWLLQLYVAAGMFMVFAASAVMENLRAVQRQLRKVAALHDLIAQNSRDVIILADFDGRRSYVSPAAANWGGWKREELLRLQSLALVHPDDRPKAAAMVRRLKQGEEGALIECRIRKRNGDYVWTEANLRPVRDPVTGTATGILNMVRDVSERKAAELALRNAYRALEAVAATDPLTHLANRRRLDQCLKSEWRRCMRERQPLSLLVLDVDLFKAYNDTYGHLRGDSCLKKIAEMAVSTVSRPGDLVARFGGEEFAVVLPRTPNEGAMELASQICESLRSRRIAHSGNPLGYLTISIGCATIVPANGQHSATLIQHADEALYEAKRRGRDQVCSATVQSQSPMNSIPKAG